MNNFHCIRSQSLYLPKTCLYCIFCLNPPILYLLSVTEIAQSGRRPEMTICSFPPLLTPCSLSWSPFLSQTPWPATVPSSHCHHPTDRSILWSRGLSIDVVEDGRAVEGVPPLHYRTESTLGPTHLTTIHSLPLLLAYGLVNTFSRVMRCTRGCWEGCFDNSTISRECATMALLLYDLLFDSEGELPVRWLSHEIVDVLKLERDKLVGQVNVSLRTSVDLIKIGLTSIPRRHLLLIPSLLNTPYTEMALRFCNRVRGLRLKG